MNRTPMKMAAIVSVALLCLTVMMPMIGIPTSSASTDEAYKVEITNKLSFETKLVIEKDSEKVVDKVIPKGEKATLENASGTYVFKVYNDKTLIDSRTATLDGDMSTSYGGFNINKNGIKAQSGQYAIAYESYNPNFTTEKTVRTTEGAVADETNTDKMLFAYYSDTITFDVTPIGTSSYAEYVGSQTFTGSGSIMLYMYESMDRSIKVFDNVTVNVGMKLAHFRDFKNVEPKSVTDNKDGTKTYVFSLGKGQTYGVYAFGGSYVTLGMKVVYSSDSSMDFLDLTADGLMKVEGKTNKTTKAEIESSGDISDIYGNADSTGWITMKNGTTTTVNTYRVFQALDSITENYFIEPKKNYRVVNGDSVTVDDNGKIAAVKDGTSFISVYSDAMNFIVVNTSAIGTPTFYPATSPDNAFVLVVTVNSDGKAPVVETGIKVNEGMNDGTVKLSGDYVDSDVDIFYYYKGTDGYRYSFTPVQGSKVTVYNPVLDSNTVVGFNTGTVTQNEGTYTALLKDGRNIIKIEKDRETVYHVIRAKEISVTVENTTSPERGEAGKVLPGDVLKITLNGVTGLQKMAGIYNPTSSLLIQDNYASEPITVKCPQYKMGVGSIEFDLTVPNNVAGTYSFFGYVSDKGWGDPTGAHHLLSSDIGKQANFDAKLRDMFNSHIDTYVLKVKGENIVRLHDGADVNELVVKDGEKLNEPEVQPVTGKLFCGWHVGSAEGRIWDFSQTVDSDLELYASWADVRTDENIFVKSDDTGKAEVSIPSNVQGLKGITVVSKETSVVFEGDDVASITGKKIVFLITDDDVNSDTTHDNDLGNEEKHGNCFSIQLTVDGQKSDLRYKVVRSYDASEGVPVIYSMGDDGRELVDVTIDTVNHKISFAADHDSSYELCYKEVPYDSVDTTTVAIVAASLLAIVICVTCLFILRK